MPDIAPYRFCKKDAATYLGIGEDEFRQYFQPYLPSAKGRGKNSRKIYYRLEDLDIEANKDYKACKNQESPESTKTPIPTFGKLTSVSPVSDFEEALAQR